MTGGGGPLKGEKRCRKGPTSQKQKARVERIDAGRVYHRFTPVILNVAERSGVRRVYMVGGGNLTSTGKNNFCGVDTVISRIKLADSGEGVLFPKAVDGDEYAVREPGK